MPKFRGFAGGMRVAEPMGMRLLLAGLLATVSIACSAPSAERTGSTSSRIIGGKATTAHPAVVVFQATADDGGECTAVLVSPTVLLTAAHCMFTEENEPLVDSSFRIFRGNDFSKAKEADFLTIDPKDVHVHPSFEGDEHDIAVLVLKEAITDVAPLALSRKPLTKADVGKPVRIVGYGANVVGASEDDDGFGLKRQLDTTIAKVDSHFVQVGKKGATACDGDSGGPAIVKVDGVDTVIGVDSFSDADVDCSEGEFYQRVDTELAFITPFLTSESTEATTANEPEPEAEPEAEARGEDEAIERAEKAADGDAKDEEPAGPAAGGCNVGHAAGTTCWPWALALVVLRRSRRKDLSAQG